jgi:hypothetical protein
MTRLTRERKVGKLMPGTRVGDGLVLTRSTREGQRSRRRVPWLAGAAVAAAAMIVGANTPSGRVSTAYVFVILDFYIGVITLVALSLTVMAGLVSTDRIVLRIGHRVLVQSVHRATAIVAVVGLGVHIAVKVLEAHAAVGDVFVPFYSQGRSLYIGFGTVAAYLLLFSYWAGLSRTRFIGRVRPWIWRLVHSLAYLCWPVAMLHGLNAGRQAATWVVVSYIACLVLVLLGLLTRIYSKFGRYATGAKAERVIGVNTQTVVMPRFDERPVNRGDRDLRYADEDGRPRLRLVPTDERGDPQPDRRRRRYDDDRVYRPAPTADGAGTTPVSRGRHSSW